MHLRVLEESKVGRGHLHIYFWAPLGVVDYSLTCHSYLYYCSSRTIRNHKQLLILNRSEVACTLMVAESNLHKFILQAKKVRVVVDK